MSVSELALTEQVAHAAVEQFASLQALVALLVRTVQAATFWVATLLPLSYLPLLATGITSERPVGFAALLCANAVAFVLGHAHRRDEV